MIDNSFKAYLVESGLYSSFRKYKSEERKSGRLNGGIINAMGFTYYLKEKNINYYYCNCLQHSYYKKRLRLSKKIEEAISSDRAIFLTLTFSDNVFETTTRETRRRYVARYLKEECSFYVANIDFGKDNNREHYHAVVIPKSSLNLFKWSKKYGFTYIRHIKTREEPRILSTYITKLTSHALKETTGRERLIFSRDSK